MSRTLLTFLATALFAVCAAAQDAPTPVPASTPDDVVKITTSLVQFDVSVTDKDGRPIRDLKPNEVRVFENGKERKISGISFVEGEPAASEKTPTNPSKKDVAPLLPGKKLAPNDVRRAIAIVVDDITLSFQSVAYTRDVLRRFVDQQMQPGDLVAIVRSSGGVSALQQFTSDKRQLYAAIDRIRWNAAANGRIGAFAPITNSGITPQPDDADATVGDERSMDDVAKEANELRENILVSGSLGALNYVIRGMEQLPGRKSVMFISEGFRLLEQTQTGGVTHGRVIDAINLITDAANRAAVVVYTLDPRGLAVPMLNAEDDVSGMTFEQSLQSVSDRASLLSDTQDGLKYLAEETGGFAIVNNNNLSKGIRKILDDQSYYLIAYEPDETSFDPKKLRFNTLEVKVSRPGTNVRYRRGFLGVTDRALDESPQAKGEARIRDAFFSPFAVTDLPFRFNSLFNYDHKNGSYLRSLVHMNIADLDFKTLPDGKRQASLDIFAYAFGANGSIDGRLQKTYKLTVPPEAYEKLRSTGFVYDFVFPIAKPGAYQLRVVVRDGSTDKVGSANQFVEIPNLKKDRLTLSGIVLNSGTSTTSSSALTATALREFHRGSLIEYGSVALNARSESAGRTNLSSRLRIFRDGKLIFTGKQQPIAQGQQPADSVAFMGTIDLGTKLEAGDYVMEVAVTDALAKERYATAVQYVEFRVVE